MIVRAAQPDELVRVGELTEAAYRADGLLGEEDDYAAVLRDARTRQEKADLLVAVDAGDVLGTVTFCLAGSDFAQVAEPGEAEFRMLAVAPHARGRGVGQRLTHECIERARSAGCKALVLSSLPVMHSAHRLYGRLGFVRDPDRDWTPYGDIHLIAYRLPLASAAGRT